MTGALLHPQSVGKGCERLRIPGIITTHKGTVLVYCEARDGGSDWSGIDIVLFRSTDGGKTFGLPKIIVIGKSSKKTMNNPVIVQDKNSVLHLIYCCMYGVNELGGGVFICSSTDDGITWSEHKSISCFTREDERNVFATGPGHGICLKNGTLAVACWLVKKSAGQAPNSHHPGSVSVLLSRDNAKTWYLAPCIDNTSGLDPNETAVAELNNGLILLNIRCGTKPQRLLTVFNSEDCTYLPVVQHPELIDAVCFGSMINCKNEILFVNCKNLTERKNLTVQKSTDGINWAHFYTVTPFNAGYSDITVNGNSIITVYEQDKCLLLHIFNWEEQQ